MFGLVAMIGAAVAGAVAVAHKVGNVIHAGLKIAEKLMPVIKEVSAVICAAAEIAAEKPAEERPEEMGRMAELGAEEGIYPEDYENTHEYLEKLRAEIKMDMKEFEKMSTEERSGYQAVGSELYIRDVQEHLGIDLGYDEFWQFAAAAKLTGKQICDLAASMKKMDIPNVENAALFAAGKLEAGSEEQHQMNSAFKEMYHQSYPEMGKGELNKTIYEMREALKQLMQTERTYDERNNIPLQDRKMVL